MKIVPFGMDTNGQARIGQTGDQITGSFIGTTGTGTLVGGTLTVSNSAVTVNSFIVLTSNFTSGTTTSTGVLSVSSKTAGTGFVVQSNNILDTQNFSWMIIG